MRRNKHKVIFNFSFIFMVSCLILLLFVLVKLLVTGTVTIPLKNIVYIALGMLIGSAIGGYMITEKEEA